MTQSAFELIVQQDLSIMVHEQGKRYSAIRLALQRFASLVKHPTGIHTFQITPLSLWNAAASGLKDADVLSTLEQYASWPIPLRAKQDISLWMNRYGLFTLKGSYDDNLLQLWCSDSLLLDRFMDDRETGVFFSGRSSTTVATVPSKHRGRLKRALAYLGYPVIDKVGYHDGEPLRFGYRTTSGGRAFELRPYQREGVQAFVGGDGRYGGDGVILLPCGAGKTIVGIGCMSELQSETLILTSNMTSVKQWRQELLAKTTIKQEQIGEYTADQKEIRPVTITTYQMMTYRRAEETEPSHMRLFHERDWGLIIYDEVHLLPAPIFRMTADLQATRRLGLTATLVREDGCERDVFSLIGAKRYELPWRQLEEQGYIASVTCTEMRVAMTEEVMERYRRSPLREKARIAGENPAKIDAARQIIERHAGVPTLVIGQYLDQLEQLAEALDAPLLTGKTKQEERDQLYGRFKRGEIQVLVVSKVANFAVDLPDATLAIQVSGSYGSRQEEAQRLGRLLRPKTDGRGAYFYTLVSDDTNEMEYALRRQLFLIEQGYSYMIEKEDENGEYSAVGTQSG